MDRRGLGKWGEDEAIRYLVAKGYTFLERNWRTSDGEIDLVMQYDSVLVFVEVKTRASDRYGGPEESVTLEKRIRLVKVCEAFLQTHQLEDHEWRIDVVGITTDRNQDTLRIEHYENAIDDPRVL